MPGIIATVVCSDPSDLDWLRTRVESAVDEVVATATEEGRLDGSAEVSIEVDFDA